MYDSALIIDALDQPMNWRYIHKSLD